VRDDRDPKVAYALYFIIWIFAGAFLVWNMFVGVVLDTFNQIRKKDDGAAFMTEEQRAWVDAQRTVYAMRPLKQFTCPSESPLRQRAFAIVMDKWFEATILVLILLNVFVMMLEWHDKPPEYELALRVCNYCFSVAFLIELLLKVTGLGARQYITNAWNAFDAVLVVLSLIDFSLELAGDVSPINPNILRVMRLFRVVRIMRVVKTAKGLRTLLVTLYSSLPALQNVMLLLGLIMFIYAIAGMLMFHDVPFGDCLNRHANFQNFWISLLTLFRCSTGESWNCIMHDAMGPDWADNAARCEEAGTCGNTGLAVGYFMTYYILGQAILLNLVIGVILENFSAIGSESKLITVEHLEEFRELWLRYDPKGTFAIPSYQLLPLVSQLSAPLGLGGKKPAASRAQLLRFMRRIDVPDHNGQIHFMETITAMANSVCGVPLPVCDETRKIAKEADKATGPSSAALAEAEHNAMTSYLVSMLQHRYRNYAKQMEDEAAMRRSEAGGAREDASILPVPGATEVGDADGTSEQGGPSFSARPSENTISKSQTAGSVSNGQPAKMSQVVPVQ